MMKQKLLDFIRANPMVSLEPIRQHMQMSKSAIGELLIQVRNEGIIDYRGGPRNKKCYFIKPQKAVIPPYEIEKTLWRVKEIPSLFIAV